MLLLLKYEIIVQIVCIKSTNMDTEYIKVTINQSCLCVCFMFCAIKFIFRSTVLAGLRYYWFVHLQFLFLKVTKQILTFVIPVVCVCLWFDGGVHFCWFKKSPVKFFKELHAFYLGKVMNCSFLGMFLK